MIGTSVIDRDVEMEKVTSVEDFAGFLVDDLIEVDHGDGYGAEYL